MNAVKTLKLDEQTETKIIEENVHIIETVTEVNNEIIGAAQAEADAEIAGAKKEEKAATEAVTALEDFQKVGESNVVAA